MSPVVWCLVILLGLGIIVASLMLWNEWVDWRNRRYLSIDNRDWIDDED